MWESELCVKILENGQDVRYVDYERTFLDHDKKISAGLEVNPKINFLGLRNPSHQGMKEDSMYVSYNFEYQSWIAPCSQSIDTVPDYELIRKRVGKKEYERMMTRLRKGQEMIMEGVYDRLLDDISSAIETLQSELEKLLKFAE